MSRTLTRNFRNTLQLRSGGSLESFPRNIGSYLHLHHLPFVALLQQQLPPSLHSLQKQRVVQDCQNGYSFCLELSVLALEPGKFSEDRTR
ncbi:hypothetical protein OIU74_023773 [Salix koriyanagi]|uniref:Uncharacterized protein n=1 Tax=Salix koriyanagi TaxID=2511006 RepID=A0A9Q0WG19_9ROSI|nr:hypothetical protein OIU74_023773 [Salix koriyanagi]